MRVCAQVTVTRIDPISYDRLGSVALLIRRRNFPGKDCGSSNWTDLSCQRIKLVGERHRIGAIDRVLALANHVHEFDAGEHATSAAERFEVEHRPGHPLDGTMVLLDDVVEVFDLAH